MRRQIKPLFMNQGWELKIILALFIFSGIAEAKSTLNRVVLNSSVLVFNDDDLKRCPEQVDKVVSLGNRKVLFVPSQHFVVNSHRELVSYCYFYETGKCEPITPQILQHF